MGWAIGYDHAWDRDIGYGVPAVCDYPRCNTQIDRGLAYVCGGEPYGGEWGCGLFFCIAHLYYTDQARQLCDVCAHNATIDNWRLHWPIYSAKPDIRTWVKWKLHHPSWELWRLDHPEEVKAMRVRIGEVVGK